MVGLDDIKSGVAGGLVYIQNNPVATAAGAAALGVAAGVGAAAIIGSVKLGKSKRRKSVSSRKTGRRIKHTKRGWKQDRKRRSKQKWEVAYQKRKRSRSKKSKRGVHYTKNGQPYKIMSNGRARFIKRRKR